MLPADLHICPLVPLHPLPRATADLPGTDGRLRTVPEDFEVEELPLYLPSGEGEHLYLWIEKIDVAADTLRRHLSRSLGVPPDAIGMAGLKDKRAVTRQWVSVPANAQARVGAVEAPGIRVLEAKLHRNKLRTAHLRGNRFRIRVREAGPDAARLARARLDVLVARGCPAFYGSQRMGHGGSTLAAGWALAKGVPRMARIGTPDGVVHQVNLADRSLRRLAASALQSHVFNCTVARRLGEGTLGLVLAGDVCRKVASGGVFVSSDAEIDRARAALGEIEPTGPMWGPKMVRATATAGALEDEVLAACGLDLDDFAALGPLAEGTRRPLVIPVTEAGLDAEVDGYTVRFVLPAGAFATVVLGELMDGGATDGRPEADACG